MKSERYLIEADTFPFEFLSQLAERESWRKEIHRPIYHVHKWWATRLGSVFRGILLGCSLKEDEDLAASFYEPHSYAGRTVLDPFMGSGTTIGEAHKLGFSAMGQDINPVAVRAVRVAFGPMDVGKIEEAFARLAEGIGKKLHALYRTKHRDGYESDVLYFFWVMQADCPECRRKLDLFSSWVIAQNAYPKRKPEVQILCPSCGDIFPGQHGDNTAACPSCNERFDPHKAPANGASVTCSDCNRTLKILDAIGGQRPTFRLYGKLVLTRDKRKQYLPATDEDRTSYAECSEQLAKELRQGTITLPALALEHGYNTRQAMNYGFKLWRDFFNDRQLLALGWLHAAIIGIQDEPVRNVMLTLFSGTLEFNNIFASYKGEGTGAVRHMFAHHILKPERTPIEANIWGTCKSSGSFSTLFHSRLMRAISYRQTPTEVNGKTGKARTCSLPFSGQLEPWPLPTETAYRPRGIYLSCGDSSKTGLADKSVDFVVTDPPFFDNVHYSELADFFYAWQQLINSEMNGTTRNNSEVQDSDARRFATKLQAVFQECRRVLKDDGLLVFTYHHSRDEGWEALARAIVGAGFAVVNAHPVKAEMSGATPKSQAKEPIQLDIILVCRKLERVQSRRSTTARALEAAQDKLQRLRRIGVQLSNNDQKIVLYGQLLTLARSIEDIGTVTKQMKARSQQPHSPPLLVHLETPA